MSYRLTNQGDPELRIRMNNWTWFGVLELAEKYGWNPRGTVTPERLELAGFHPGNGRSWFGSYWGSEVRLVLLEDALNLADALDDAFIKYEPRRLLSLHPFHLGSANGDQNGHMPAVGVIQLMIEFCQEGAFTIEMM